MKKITKAFLISNGIEFFYDNAKIRKDEAEYCIEDGDQVYMWRNADGEVFGGVKNGTHILTATLPSSAWECVKGEESRITMPDTFTRFSAAM